MLRPLGLGAPFDSASARSAQAAAVRAVSEQGADVLPSRPATALSATSGASARSEGGRVVFFDVGRERHPSALGELGAPAARGPRTPDVPNAPFGAHLPVSSYNRAGSADPPRRAPPRQELSAFPSSAPPKLLARLERFVTDELHARGPHAKRHEVLREAYRMFADHFGAYRPFLAAVDGSVEDELARMRDRVRTLNAQLDRATAAGGQARLLLQDASASGQAAQQARAAVQCHDAFFKLEPLSQRDLLLRLAAVVGGAPSAAVLAAVASGARLGPSADGSAAVDVASAAASTHRAQAACAAGGSGPGSGGPGSRPVGGAGAVGGAVGVGGVLPAACARLGSSSDAAALATSAGPRGMPAACGARPHSLRNGSDPPDLPIKPPAPRSVAARALARAGGAAGKGARPPIGRLWRKVQQLDVAALKMAISTSEIVAKPLVELVEGLRKRPLHEQEVMLRELLSAMAEEKRVVWLQSVGHFVRPTMRVNIVLGLLKLLPYDVSLECLRELMLRFDTDDPMMARIVGERCSLPYIACAAFEVRNGIEDAHDGLVKDLIAHLYQMRESEAPIFKLALEATRCLRPFARRQLLPTIEDDTIFYRPDSRAIDALRSATDLALAARLFSSRKDALVDDGSGGVASAERMAKLGAALSVRTGGGGASCGATPGSRRGSVVSRRGSVVGASSRRNSQERGPRTLVTVEIAPALTDARKAARSERRFVARAHAALRELSATELQAALDALASSALAQPTAVIDFALLSNPPPSPPRQPPITWVMSAADDADPDFARLSGRALGGSAIAAITLALVGCTCAVLAAAGLVLRTRWRGGTLLGITVWSERERSAAAAVLQAAYRGFKARQLVRLLRTQRDLEKDRLESGKKERRLRDEQIAARTQPRLSSLLDPVALYNRLVWRPPEEHV
ncbi:hypothetical protein KFE25_013984 [Diacronema lutheri]|uniref:Uncharacterized protein n=1 Tax=Diacronema lutheri TaxID=2081491 RepID=A0A8J5XMT0_DIALT|nr:hypothetical protein KFE25_013984 [Diacronema lutheri]